MKHWYYTFRFFFACAIIFGGGYFFAKPRNDADKSFAPAIAAIGVLSLWRTRKSKEAELPGEIDSKNKSNLRVVIEWGVIILAAIAMWVYYRFGVR
jgi:hypothetical protein